MNARAALTIGLSAALVGSPLAAQSGADHSNWSFDVQGGAAVPTSEIDGDDLGTGFGFEVNVARRLATHVSLYAGWDWHRFAPDVVLGESDLDFEETGYVFGLRFQHPFSGESGEGASYRLRAGVTVNHVELEDADGELVDDSGHGAGFEVGAGVLVPFGENWSIGPEARFRSLGRELDVGGGEVGVDLRYVTLDLVVSRRF
jgi:opacity protein-like surface antigen